MSLAVNKLIILDRDGVINEDRDDYVKSAEEWVPIPNSLEAIALLSQAGYILTIATNQSGIARGFYPLSELHAMHQKMMDLLKPLGGKIDGIFFCPHVDEDQCCLGCNTASGFNRQRIRNESCRLTRGNSDTPRSDGIC